MDGKNRVKKLMNKVCGNCENRLPFWVLAELSNKIFRRGICGTSFVKLKLTFGSE